jgi:transcription elongation factor Elf1
MPSAIRYSGSSGADPDFNCPVCNNLMILTYTHTTRESGVAFQCPYCYEWLRFKEVSGNKPPNLSDEEAERWHAVEIVRLDKEEIKKMLQKKTNTEIFEWEA